MSKGARRVWIVLGVSGWVLCLLMLSFSVRPPVELRAVSAGLAQQIGMVMAWIGWTLCAVLLALFVKRQVMRNVDQRGGWSPSYAEMTVIWVGASVLWWFLAGSFEAQRISWLIASSATALATGAIVGFLFTSYDEESESIGKVRNWLLGGITGLTIAELATGAGTVRAILTLFQAGDPPAAAGLHACNLVGYSVLGFFGSFILREVWLNPLFAKARRQRRELASAIDSATDAVKTASEAWSKGLASVDEFETPDNVTYSQAMRVVDSMEAWKLANLGGDPQTLLVVARSYAIVGQHAAAAGAFERIIERSGFDRTALVGAAMAYEELGAHSKAGELVKKYIDRLGDDGRQWLSFYLLHDPDTVREAAEYAELYLNAHQEPGNGATHFNAACAYAQVYAATGQETARASSLDYLGQAGRINPVWLVRAKQLSGWNDDFYALRGDNEFLSLVGTPRVTVPDSRASAAPAAKGGKKPGGSQSS